MVTADHGQIDVGPRVELLGPRGHGHGPASCPARVGSAGCTPAPAPPDDLAALLRRAVRRHHLGGEPGADHRRGLVRRARCGDGFADRLGDVALLPFEPIAFMDPADTGENRLASRHGSLTTDEMLVPLVALRRRTSDRDPTTPTPDHRPAPDRAGPLHPEVVDPPGTDGRPPTARPPPATEPEERPTESIEQPAKLLRIGSMVKQLLEEVRQAPLDEASRGRLREIYEQSIRELADGLSPDLAAELDRVSIPFDSDTPSDAELRIAHAQLVGLAGGTVPRDPGHAGGPAGGGPGPAGRDAPAVAARRRRPTWAARAPTCRAGARPVRARAAAARPYGCRRPPVGRCRALDAIRSR